MNSKFAAAMASYVILAILGGIVLTGKMRTAVWIFLGGLAAKTVIVVMSRKEEDAAGPPEESDSGPA